MTLKLFRSKVETDSDNPKELLSLVEDARRNGVIDKLELAQIKSDISRKYRPVQSNNNNTKPRISYTKEQIEKIMKSHLDVYDDIKDLSAHLNFMKQLFGEKSSQFRNGVKYNKHFHETLNKGEANLGHSMSAKWLDTTLELIKDRPVQFENTLDACQKIYDEKNNGKMLQVIQIWRGGI